MTSMYDGVEVRVPLRCLGCADTITNVGHQCAGDRELAPYGGLCECPRSGCGPSAAPAAKRRARR
ncbi:hypothetical protein ABZ807_05470 [Micromonospora sp. NPDC047548]|uniref:hypothetical protein n=1 Tax=Micromonospora sp. NPDC047548 TaxID=3155624 RepID=UPI0033D4FD49